MKKILAPLFVVTLLAACGDGNPDSHATSDTARSALDSMPDASQNNAAPANAADSATPSTPGRSGAATPNPTGSNR